MAASPTPPPRPANVRLDQVEPLLAELKGVTAAAQTGADDLSAPAVLDVYVRAVREFRAVAVEARGRIERAASVVAEAREAARRHRRRAAKAAARAAREAGSAITGPGAE